MAQLPQPQPQYEFHYQRVELLKTESLGIGSYGAVCKALCDDLPCAAKILHPTLFQFTSPGAKSVMQKFEQECRLLSAIKHPYVVQYLGTYIDNDSNLPVLLMELMDESLTRFLERSHKPLPFHTEINLSNDIALALSYLHSNGIVHRDLSSNNVLLIAGSRAKVTDFGMVKLYDMNRNTPQFTPLTLCPGTMAYMSPEALRDRPVYNDKLDSFSFGVLCVQIMTRQFPDPGDRFNIIEINDPRAPTGRVQVEVPEINRRQFHIDLIDPSHPLLSHAVECLKDNDKERPSCHQLCGCLSRLKASSQYIESVHQSTIPEQSVNREDREAEMQQSQQVQDLQQQLHTLSDQLQEREQEIQQQQQHIMQLQNLLAETNGQLQTIQQQLTIKDEQLAGKDHHLQQKEVIHQQEIQQLRQSSEHVAAGFQQTLLEKEKTIRDQQKQILELLQQQPRQRGGQRRETSAAAANSGSIQLRWRDGGRAPCKMWGAVAVMSGGVAFFRPRGHRVQTVTTYNSAINKWSELPKCPNHFFSLAVINSLLTAIGGKRRNHEFTNSLLSLADNKWTELFPPMPTKRWLTTVVCSGRTLVVAGGTGEGDKRLNTVEVMNTESLQWSTASSLPHPLSEASVTLCGDHIYMLSRFDQAYPQADEPSKKLVFTCSLTSLLQSCQPQSLREPASGPKVWHKLADTPYYHFTCVSLRGQLLVVGGCDSEGQNSTAIHAYNTTTNSWEVISHLATPRSQCLIAVLPHNELMVVGGYTPDGKTDSVEIATIT